MTTVFKKAKVKSDTRTSNNATQHAKLYFSIIKEAIKFNYYGRLHVHNNCVMFANGLIVSLKYLQFNVVVVVVSETNEQ